MFNIGDTVRILMPFSPFFPDNYVITNIVDTTTWLEGLDSAFDFIYIEKV